MQMQAEAKKEALRRATEEEIQAERRKTDEHRAALERENMKERALAEAEGRIREKRANEDLFLRQVRLLPPRMSRNLLIARACIRGIVRPSRVVTSCPPLILSRRFRS